MLSVGYGALLTALLGIIFATSVILVLQGTKRDELHLQGVIEANNIIAIYNAKDLDELMNNSYKLEGISNFNGEINIYKNNEFIVLDVILHYSYSNKNDFVNVRGYRYVGE